MVGSLRVVMCRNPRYPHIRHGIRFRVKAQWTLGEWKLGEVEKSRLQEHSGTQTSFTCDWCDFFSLIHSATLKTIFTHLGLREHSPCPHVKELLSDSGRNKWATKSLYCLVTRGWGSTGCGGSSEEGPPSRKGIGEGLKFFLEADMFLLKMGRGWGGPTEELAGSGANKKLGYFHQPLARKGEWEASNGALTLFFFLLESCHVPPQRAFHG